jgi:hypothetical protein
MRMRSPEQQAVFEIVKSKLENINTNWRSCDKSLPTKKGKYLTFTVYEVMSPKNVNVFLFDIINKCFVNDDGGDYQPVYPDFWMENY